MSPSQLKLAAFGEIGCLGLGALAATVAWHFIEGPLWKIVGALLMFSVVSCGIAQWLAHGNNQDRLT